MALITVSRGSYSMGSEIAARVAVVLGYECLSREILLETSEQFNIPEIQLQHAFNGKLSIFDRLTHGKQKYVAFIQSALTRHMCKDNVVYHGLAGHLLLRNMSHLLKVRIVADPEVRISNVMEKTDLGHSEAAALIAKSDNDRTKWTRSLYGVDPWDSQLYDLVLNIPRFTVEDAVDLICRSSELAQFRPTQESRQAMEDLALACQVKAALVEKHHKLLVAATYGNVVIYGDFSNREADKLNSEISTICAEIEGINNIEVHPGISAPDNAV